MKELLYCWVSQQFSVLVPKKRGEVYLRVPYGHHHINELTNIANKMQCDICGLDGALDFNVSRPIYFGIQDDRDAFAEKLMHLLEKYYGLPSREVDAPEFWRAHPITKARQE